MALFGGTPSDVSSNAGTHLGPIPNLFGPWNLALIRC